MLQVVSVLGKALTRPGNKEYTGLHPMGYYYAPSHAYTKGGVFEYISSLRDDCSSQHQVTDEMDTLQRSYRYGTSALPPSSLSIPYNAHLFGGNISRSLSPLLHGILFRSMDASWGFHLIETTDPSTFQDKLGAADTIGASITMPNKVTFGRLLDDLTDEARVIGAVNTMFIRRDSTGRLRYIGTNTDCVGIREAIIQQDPAAPSTARGKPAMVIGGGGAARSAIYALWAWFSPSEIYIANRLESEVNEIVKYFLMAMPGIKLRYIRDSSAAESLAAPSIVVGTVPDYPPSGPGERECWRVCETVLKKEEKGLLVDMCYMPSPDTRLLGAARDAGWRTIAGTEVLVRVCVAQQMLWLEKEPNEQGVRKAVAAVSGSSRASKL